MKEKVLQCCYTNALRESGGKVTSGWETVAVSSEIPQEALKNCTQIQNVNSTIQGAMVDEFGKLLNLYEICGDGTYVYVIRTQYGLQDRLGRGNMFSHAFIFSWDEGKNTLNPNRILGVDDSNFKVNEEDASQIPDELNRSFELNPELAMEKAGMNEEQVLSLIQCVYTQMTDKKIGEPLFVQYDGTQEQMKAILFCLYYGLPYYLRKKLCIASAAANNMESKNVVFSPCAQKHTYYFLPETGDNNILTARIQKKFERYGFLDYVAKNMKTVNAPAYFERLEQSAQQLGDPAGSNELILKIAYQLTQNDKVQEFGDEELEERISDALRSNSVGSEAMERYIAEMVTETYERKLVLTEENEESLEMRLSTPFTEEFANAGEKYNIYRLSTLTCEQAAQKLAHFEEDRFITYRKQLVKTTKGTEILDEYYSQISLERERMSWELLERIFEESDDLAERSKTLDRLEYFASDLYRRSIFEDDTHKVLSMTPELERYLRFEEKLVGEERLEECENAAKEEFWDVADFTHFSIDLRPVYKLMNCQDPRCRRNRSLYNLIMQLKKVESKQFLHKTAQYFIGLSEELKKEEVDQARKAYLETLHKKYEGEEQYFETWCELFSRLSSSEEVVNILLLYSNKAEGEYDTFVENYRILLEEYEIQNKNRKIHQMLSGLLKEEFVLADENGIDIPLDVWLVLGCAVYTNPFNIFEKIKPSVLEREDFDVVQESSLIHKTEYIRDAEAYVKGKGEEAKNVKRWLSEVKKAKKQKKTENEPEGDGWLGRGLSVWSKKTQEFIGDDISDDEENGTDKKGRFGFLKKK